MPVNAVGHSLDFSVNTFKPEHDVVYQDKSIFADLDLDGGSSSGTVA